MTSEIESLKTNEFLRRRKLRLLQVREQSKDIAKKLRQRANVEKLRQTGELEDKKQKDYFDKQEKLVKRLEVLYAKGLDNVGASHRSASDVRQHDTIARVDISKVRAREAATELKRKKQQKLDEQKRLLDRKLQARETANELSREKSSVVANKLLTKSSTTKYNTQNIVDSVPDQVTKENDGQTELGSSDPQAVTTTDMATQWDSDRQPSEWEPAVPTLSLPKDDRDSIKESENNIIDSKSSKRLDLFALSKEMPSSLRGGKINIPDERIPVKPSLTLVSEYLQSRGLRLRESDTSSSNKKPSEDLNSIKQIIQRSRASRAEGSSVCHVLDGQVIPVPTWRQADQPSPHNKQKHTVKSRQFNSITNSQINKIFSSIRPAQQEIHPSPMLRGSSPFRRSKIVQKTFSGKASNNIEKTRSNSQDSRTELNRKNSVTVYNHSTRNTLDVQCRDNKLVVRDRQTEEDAYAQAMKETNADNMRDKEHHKKIQDMRNKVAMTKQNVEKEYKDTMNFLNSIPKDKCSKGVRNSYMDNRRHQIVEENRQHKLQQEFKKIEKECKRQHHCNKSRSKSKSPTNVNIEIDNDFESKDFQYSWMPVPESDGSLAVHTIPTTTKEGKSSNTVKFSKVDSYHEYRSRHKHTPPTKDTASNDKPRKNVIETVIHAKSSSESVDSSSISSDTSSVDDMRSLNTRDKERKNRHKQPEQNMSDAERIIIYKVLDSQRDNKSKKKAQMINDIAKSLTSTEKGLKSSEHDNIELARKRNSKNISKETENRVSFEQLNEGVYKMVNDKGNNVTSMYFNENQHENENVKAGNDLQNVESCSCKKPTKEQRDRGKILSWECGDEHQTRIPNVTTQSAHTSKLRETPASQPSATTSSTSFKTIINDKPNVLSEDGFIKLVDDAGQEAGKFYIGATGFFKDDDYEMVIQLKKKGGKEDKVVRDDEPKVLNIRKETEVVQLATDVNVVHNSADEEVRHILAETRSLEILSKRSSPPTICEDDPNTNIQPKETRTEQEQLIDVGVCENSDDGDTPKPAATKNNLVDKGVGTSFQLSYAIPTHIPKDDPVSRPATSTCTQTTLSSPNHRPVLFHMSSSTSTAYMSPPEMVLPKFLRRELYLPENEMVYEPVQKVEITQRQDICQRYPSCACKRCTNARSATMKVKESPYYRSEYDNKILFTPPNTARSCSSRHRHELPTHKHRVDASPIPSMAKCRCKKCDSGIRFKTCVKTDSQKCKRNFGGYKRTNSTINTRIGSSSTARTKQKMTSSCNAKLNPVIKEYVNRLLDLNKEGFKVIEVMDQECSSVPTPSSSIINVPCNVDERKGPLEKKISLEQIRYILKKQMFEEHMQKVENKAKDTSVGTTNSSNKILKPSIPRKPRLKPVHKVKSLNISKHLLKTRGSEEVKKVGTKPVSTSATEDNANTLRKPIPSNTKSRSKSSPSPRQVSAFESTSRYTDTYMTNSKTFTNTEKSNHRRLHKDDTITPSVKKQPVIQQHINSIRRSHRATMISTSPDSESSGVSQKYKPEIPISMSTQTSQNVDSEASFMKLAEDKLHNMEKIADLTEKCTLRLSNLAKVLEEVRKNKSLVYSAISTTDSTSDSDQKSDKIVTPIPCDLSDNGNIELPDTKPHKQEKETETKKANNDAHIEFTPFLTDIPKPAALKVPNSNILQSSKSVETINLPSDLNVTPENGAKIRPKPPPALTRIHLKHGQELVPHELSTVLEVDSPMSVKHKNQSCNNIQNDFPDNASSRATNDIEQNQEVEDKNNVQRSQETNANPDLLQSNMDSNKYKQYKSSSTETSDDSKFQMIDLKHFNDIMLEPFISINEYAKQYNVEHLDEGSNMEEVHKDVIKDDVSSLHSDGSLPDVIAELLKRNIITEPFKFDTASNINSTLSSESTMSVLALSKVRKEKKKSSVMFQNKENIAETSDSLSISSNPDLENAFKKLGMGWASSTLKKTKERLALSSSSNTSSSSVSQFKMKSFNPDIPALVTDSVSSALNLSKKDGRGALNESSKNAEQQTSLINSMTVKEFLNNELAKKITFTNKSNRNDTEEEFVSLFETKMPEEMKEDHSMSMHSGGNNRARTSTPVQIFKSMTYHSSSSSNISNGLFSNADDLSSVKMTSNSMKNHSTSDKDDLTVPNFSLRFKKSSDCSKSD